MNANTLKWFIIATVFWSVILVSFNYFIDPIQYYGKKDGQPFIKTMRYQIPGLIRSYPFDTIMVGTSHSANFSPMILDDAMNVSSLNLSVNASSGWEQKQIVNLAAKHRSLKNVVWELNYRTLANDASQRVNSGIFPNYFYEQKLSAHFYYLYSLDTVWKSIKVLLGRGHKNIGTINAWMDKHGDKFDGENVKNHYCERLASAPPAILTSKNQYLKAINSLLIPMITNHPHIKFKFFIPPLSQYNYALPGEFEKFSKFREVAYQQLSLKTNVELYDFSNNFEWILVAENYKDVEHYSASISDNMLMAMANKDFLVTRDDSVIHANSVLMQKVNLSMQNTYLFPNCER